MRKIKTSTTTILLRILLATGTPISLYFVPWPIVKAWVLPLPDGVEGQLELAIKQGYDGLIVYVDKGGEAPQYFGAGWKDREKKIPADPHAYFKIASINKLYVAVSITKLAHAGSLSLDGTLAEYFPEYATRIEHAEKITIRNMVMHRSGLPNFTDTPDFWVNPPKTEEASIELILDLPAEFLPGEKWMYSNTNYLLLIMLIEKVTQAPTFEFIQKEILDPLNLQKTHWSKYDIDNNQLMSGYYVGVEEDIKTADYGAMIATAEDVGRFVRAINEGSVFNGAEAETYDSIYEMGHGGLLPGYQSSAFYHKDIDAVVVLVANTTDFTGYEINLFNIYYDRIIEILRRES